MDKDDTTLMLQIVYMQQLDVERTWIRVLYVEDFIDVVTFKATHREKIFWLLFGS